MEAVAARVDWTGAERGELYLMIEGGPRFWGHDFVYPAGDEDADGFDVAVLRGMTDDEAAFTDEIAGLWIGDFLTFSRWDDLPLPQVIWRLPGDQSRATVDLLKRLQAKLRAREPAGSARRA